MKKKVIIVALGLMCALSFGGCGNEDNTSNVVENNAVTEEPINTKDDEKQPTDSADADNKVETNKQNEDNLSDEEIEAAKKVAMDYYAETIFEVNSMTYIEPGTNSAVDGECNFMVNVSKNGQVQIPDRMICLNRSSDSWKVVNEGF